MDGVSPSVPLEGGMPGQRRRPMDELKRTIRGEVEAA